MFAPLEISLGGMRGFLGVCIMDVCILGYYPCICMNFLLSRGMLDQKSPHQLVTNFVLSKKACGL